MERLTICVGYQNGNPIYKTNIDMRRIGAVDKLKNALGKYEDAEEQAIELQDKRINMLIQYIFDNMHWCPFKDEAKIDFEKECVGFREKGCKECILRNIEQLN